MREEPAAGSTGGAVHGLAPNYEYVLRFLAEILPRSGRALDYGCGAGEVVMAARNAGLDVFGAEAFYEGGDTRTLIVAQGLLGTVVREITDDHVGFPDEFFDCVVCNQVLEHVQSLDASLSEMHRLLKPGGRLLALFPSRDVWSEGHCGIPFLHRFPKGSRPRVYYAMLWRTLGKGYHKSGKTIREWSEDFCHWLDDFTFYRGRDEIDRAFRSHFETVRYHEPSYLHFRVARLSRPMARVVRAVASSRLGSLLLTEFVRKKGGLVIVATRSLGSTA